MTKKPPVYQENPAFQSPIRGNRHSETQQANAARVRICRAYFLLVDYYICRLQYPSFGHLRVRIPLRIGGRCWFGRLHGSKLSQLRADLVFPNPLHIIKR